MWPLLCLSGALALAGASAGRAQTGDPLTEREVDQVREYADRPPERVKLYLKFIEQRMERIRQIGASRTPDTSGRMHNLLEEFTRLVDELQDNLDGYASSHADVRKALKDLIADSAKWPEVLQKIPVDISYDYSLKTAREAAESANEAATKMAAEQEQYFATHKPDKEAVRRNR